MLQPPRIPLPNLANKRSYTPVCPGSRRISPVVRSSWRSAVPLLASAFSLPDAWIAAYNLNAYKAGKLSQLHISDFSDLSDDAYLLYPDYRQQLEEMSPSVYEIHLTRRWEKDAQDPFRQYNYATWRFMKRYQP